MTARAPDRATVISAALSTLSNGTDLAARPRVDDGWLLLAASLGSERASATGAWDLLRWNGLLGGGARFAVRRDRPDMLVRADIPLDDPVDLPRRIREACAGFQAAHSLLAHDAEEETASTVSVSGDGIDLTELCRETGWSCVERDPGRLVVELDVPGDCYRAAVETRGTGVAVSVRVPETIDHALEPPAPVCRRALGRLLVRVCGIVRMARAAAEVRHGIPRPRFEVVFESEPCAAELSHAFAALSVACRIAARETAVLWTDETIARAYLAQRHSITGGDDGRDSDEDARTPGN
jgi:hypothetical protein